jgi:hypothetical protein
MIEATGSSVTGQSRGPFSNDSMEIMNPPPIPDDWRTHWHLVAHLDQLAAGGVIDVVVAGTRVQISDDGSGLTANGDGRVYPVMVVDDEIFMFSGDESD